MSSILNDASAILFSEFLYKTIHCGYWFELLQMSFYNIFFYKEVDKSTLIVISRLLNCFTVHL